MDDFATGYLAGQDGGNNGGGFFGNEGLWAVIILAIIFGWGTKGCHWTLEQTQDVAKQRNITCDPNDFWAVMNMMYSDYCQVAKRQSVDTPGFYADMAKAFLDDTDAVDGKAYAY